MHLHLHLKECIFQYGPVYVFWTFSFARSDGILGEHHTNNHSMMISMMRKFIDGVQIVASYDRIQADNLPHRVKCFAFGFY